MSFEQQILEEVKKEVKRRLWEESVPRLEKCLDQLKEEEIWYRPNEHSNSVGNLVLHLCGNVRQWIVSGLGNVPDIRRRQEEFDERGPVPTATLLEKLRQLKSEVNRTLDQLSPEDLTARFSVQGFDESGLSILIHVVEHFSYHTGQVTYFVKALRNLDMGYYQGLNLNQKSQ